MLCSLVALSSLACGSSTVHTTLHTDGGSDTASADVSNADANAGDAAESGPDGGGGSGGTDGVADASSDDRITPGSDANDGGTDADAVDAHATDGPGDAPVDAEADGGDAHGDAKDDLPPTGSDAGDTAGLLCGGMTLYGLTGDSNCFDIVSVAAGASDGCDLGVAEPPPNGLVGTAIPVTYAYSEGVVIAGTDGTLGRGDVRCNVGTLTSATSPTLDGVPGCSWHQTTSSVLHMTALNEFDLGVTEEKATFSATCPGATIPPGAHCTSTWTWHLKMSSTKSLPDCR